LWAYLAGMSKFPSTSEAIRGRIEAALTERGRDLSWLADQIGVTPFRLLEDFTAGVSVVFLWDISEILGVSREWLAVGRA
jgi:hypothetical protein